MTGEEMRNQLHAQPFRPFVLRLADGTRIPVHHPDFVAISPSGRIMTVYQPDDSSNVLDVMLVIGLEFQPNGEQQPAS